MTAEAFVYAHILENMFNSQAKPFYNSAQQKHLERIDKDKYTAFAINQFRLAGRELKPEAAALAYDLFEGHTYYVHSILHNAFAYLEPKQIVGEEEIRAVLSDILEEKAPGFASIMNRLNYQQKEVIVAIAKEGKATEVTSVAFVRRHALKSPSSVQYAISSLLEKQLLTYDDVGRKKVYSVADRFLGMWICRAY